MSDASAKGPAPLIDVRNIVKHFGSVIALSGVSLSVGGGEVHCLLGDNGAGKSTTLKSISGLLNTENGEVIAGDVRFDGQSITHRLADRIVRSGIFQVMEGRRIIGDMTVLENLRAGAHTRRDREIDAFENLRAAEGFAQRPDLEDGRARRHDGLSFRCSCR